MPLLTQSGQAQRRIVGLGLCGGIAGTLRVVNSINSIVPVSRRFKYGVTASLLGILTLWTSPPIRAQEVEIRRWNHLPINKNFLTVNYAHAEGDIGVDPTLRLEGVTVELDTWLLGYIRTFELFDKTARLEVRQAWQLGTWDGLVDDVPRTVN
jgi:hypothetical protein